MVCKPWWAGISVMIAACLSTAWFPHHLFSGVAEEQVRFAVHVLHLVMGWCLCGCPEGLAADRGSSVYFCSAVNCAPQWERVRKSECCIVCFQHLGLLYTAQWKGACKPSRCFPSYQTHIICAWHSKSVVAPGSQEYPDWKWLWHLCTMLALQQGDLGSTLCSLVLKQVPLACAGNESRYGQKKWSDAYSWCTAGTNHARQGRIILHFAVTLILLLHSANYNPDMI